MTTDLGPLGSSEPSELFGAERDLRISPSSAEIDGLSGLLRSRGSGLFGVRGWRDQRGGWKHNRPNTVDRELAHERHFGWPGGRPSDMEWQVSCSSELGTMLHQARRAPRHGNVPHSRSAVAIGRPLACGHLLVTSGSSEPLALETHARTCTLRGAQGRARHWGPSGTRCRSIRRSRELRFGAAIVSQETLTTPRDSLPPSGVETVRLAPQGGRSGAGAVSARATGPWQRWRRDPLTGFGTVGAACILWDLRPLGGEQRQTADVGGRESDLTTSRLRPHSLLRGVALREIRDQCLGRARCGGNVATGTATNRA